MVGQHHQLNGHEFEQTPGDRGEESRVLQLMESQRVGHDLMTERQQHQNQKGTNYIVPVCK